MNFGVQFLQNDLFVVEITFHIIDSAHILSGMKIVVSLSI